MSVSFVFLSKYFKLLIVYEPKILNYQADINIPSDIHRAKDKISYLYQWIEFSGYLKITHFNIRWKTGKKIRTTSELLSIQLDKNFLC